MVFTDEYSLHADPGDYRAYDVIRWQVTGARKPGCVLRREAIVVQERHYGTEQQGTRGWQNFEHATAAKPYGGGSALRVCCVISFPLNSLHVALMIEGQLVSEVKITPNSTPCKLATLLHGRITLRLLLTWPRSPLTIGPRSDSHVLPVREC